jgi:hypothetical protein
MDSKKTLRPIIESISDTESNVSEKFQNEILRPIIKLQHALLIVIFRNYAVSRKTNLKELPHQKFNRFVNSAVTKDINFKNQIIGVIVGLFTVEEYTEYCQISSEINKRISQITIQRLKDSYDELIVLSEENE